VIQSNEPRSVSPENVAVPGLPAPLRPLNKAVAVDVSADALSIAAGARTDWFIDPGSDIVSDNAPALVMPAEGSWMLRARVSTEHNATFDAAVLVVYADNRTWAKLCLELSPQGQVLVVSVVTRGDSDDCNSVAIEGSETWLRISRLERAFAFHHSPDGETWHLVRYFGLGDAESIELGFLAQSPTGEGCRASFQDISFTPEKLEDVRSGI
jgi:regulation of enolase protein 1 (concanavalin A-like superfamily)